MRVFGGEHSCDLFIKIDRVTSEKKIRTLERFTSPTRVLIESHATNADIMVASLFMQRPESCSMVGSNLSSQRINSSDNVRMLTLSYEKQHQSESQSGHKPRLCEGQHSS